MVPIRAYYQNVPHLRLGQQVLEQAQRRYIQPLQVIQKQHQRMLRRGEHAKKPAHHPPQTIQHILRRDLRSERLRPDDQREFWNQLNDEVAIGTQCLQQALAPCRDLGAGMAQELAHEVAERLRERGVRDFLIRVALSRGEPAAGLGKLTVKFMDERGLADAGVACNQHEHRYTGSTHLLVCRAQRRDLALTAVQSLRSDQPIRYVLAAQRKGLDAAVPPPLLQAVTPIRL